MRRHIQWCAACCSAALFAIHGTLLAQTAEQKTAEQKQPPAVTAPPAPIAKPSVVNRLNDVLPTWLRVRGELRERMEGFEHSGFARARDDLYWLTRVRLHATVTASNALSFQVQAQDARVARKTVGPTGTQATPGASYSHPYVMATYVFLAEK